LICVSKETYESNLRLPAHLTNIKLIENVRIMAFHTTLYLRIEVILQNLKKYVFSKNIWQFIKFHIAKMATKNIIILPWN
jgi:hypothetical protein